MRREFSYHTEDGAAIHVYNWPAENPKAAVQISHGAVEHALRYEEFAQFLVGRGFSVYADDHRAHGNTAGSPEKVTCYEGTRASTNLLADDMHALTDIIKKETGLPVFLLGHSMGSHLSRIYAAKYGDELSGMVLTGTGREKLILLYFGMALSKLIIILFGRKHISPFLHNFAFGVLNKPFKSEGESAFICADPEVVEAYRKDDYCSTTSTAEYIYIMVRSTREAFKKSTINGCPKDLPIFIGSGEYDTVGGGEGLWSVRRDVQDYKKAGVRRVDFKVYEGMRHEILNEKGKNAVWEDIAQWMSERADKIEK